jgi:UDP-N-acetylmuramoyl-tripeptide--D-alanyl-D-alanine ligase
VTAWRTVCCVDQRIARSAMKDVVKNAIDSYLAFWTRVVLRVRRPAIVGITGSVGKTTTKEIIAAVLSHPDAPSRVGRVRRSPENLNDNRGLPLAVLGYDDWLSRWQLATCMAAAPWRAFAAVVFGRCPDVFVLEYAASDHGDVPWLAKVAPPTVAVVTAIGPAHLERFGTVERIIREKGALVEAVPCDGLVVLGADNRNAAALDSRTDARVVKVPGSGRALSENAARVIGRHFGIPDMVIERALPVPLKVRGRLDVRALGEATLIDDSFNANPLSMELGLSTIAEHATLGQRKVVVLGDMRELGSEAPRYHREIGALGRAVADIVVGVGPLARNYEPHRWYATADDCAHDLSSWFRPGDLVYVKGSAAIELFRVVSALKRVVRDQNARSS